MQKTAVQMNENTNSYCDGNKTVLELFEDIVKYDNPEVLFDFSWSKEIKAEECTLSCVTLTQCDLKIPVSIESIERLKQISLKLSFHNIGYNLPAFNSHLRKTWEISASEISGSIQQDINLSSLVAYHLQLPNEMKITTKFAGLIMYNYGNSFIHNLGSCCVEGKFGTATLQVPVEGGHEGGRLNVEYNRKKVAFENHGNSDKNFYLTAYYNCCEEFMEPVTRGHKLILVFDLIWANAKTEIPKNFPVFLTALKVIQQVLKTWIRQNVVNSELMSPPPSISKNQEDSLDTSNQFISEWTLKEKILFFILKEKYEEDSLAFELLLGKDRVLAELLLNSGFLDVHLAMANSEIKNESVNKKIGEEGSIAISSFIDSDDVTRNLSFELDWNKHFVELIQSNQEKEARSENRKDKIELGKRNLYHGVLVIWPKHHSIPIYCRFGLPSLLIRMGHMLNSSSKWKNEARQSVKSDLQQLLSFCRAEPLRAWTTSGLGKGELTLRLLRFCITLRAREEGLDLLKLLGSKFDSDNFEGIQNDQVARAIADFVSQVSGWGDVVELIEPLLSCDRITKQLLPVMKLAKCLLRSNCVEGARMVGDSVSSFFAELDQTHAAKLKKSDVEAYMDMVISLETNPNTCCRLRIASFILFLYKLRPLQYRLVWDLKTQYSWYLKSMQSFQFLLDELHENLVNLSEVCSVSSPRSADNVSSALSLIPVNDKENSENRTSSSGIQSGTGSLLTSFVSSQTHSKFFLEKNEQASNTSPKSSVAISLNVPCDESINPQVLVQYNSPRKNVSIPNYPETTPCISGRGFLLERFREVFDSAVEGENSLTGGSIRSISDYLFQLRDFEMVYEAILMSSAVKSHHQAVSDHSIADFDFIQKSIQEKRSNKSDKSENQQVMVPDHSPWNTASKSNHPDSSSFQGKGFLLERFRELWNPSFEHGTSITGGSIRSISDYEFQLRDFESAYAEVSGAAVSANQLPEYGMVGNALSNEWFRKPSQVEDNHSKAPAVGLVSSTSSPFSGFHSTVTARCEDDREYLKIALENTLLDNAETSTSSCRADSITEPKTKSNSGENTISNGINKPTPPAYRTYESPSCTVTDETDTLPKTESSISTAFKDRSSLDINETLQKPDKFFWKGDINSKDVGKFKVRAFEVNASKFIRNLNMPSTLELIGRIKPEVIWDYINQTRRTGTRDIFVFSFIPASDSSLKVYSSFIRHMHHKERFAVVGPFSKLIKDFYLVPLIKDSPIPSALISFSRVFENRSSSILLGIVIPRRKREALQSLRACVPAVPSNTP